MGHPDLWRLDAAAGCAAGLGGFGGADEGAEEFSFYVRGDGVYVDAGLREELACVFEVVDAGWFEVDAGESGGGKFGCVFGLFEGSGDAADPEEHALADGGVDGAAGDHVRDGEAAAGAQHAEGFGQDSLFV